ncbi:MAG: hypothetical protein A2X05_11590 [Bacteroidetes bacterium GWE2_41_25]|nr:MAG: hypothetical protein A2X03_00010 [Bacteroidetes bacterium GWA2_40_15]OFX96163.1 MAG: hypothetical protein A2X05_11590 [Bacteroidetes bacterium GWE2_41_25]OFY60572.1 MAG: hypothetical protein A2X04_08605 [Bacteroidetes bacterium GWF2_41_9]HAM08965.1 hypothetical protein [Bacteroidales bacterium]HBQ84290.1 hypothetical protein [Bacteroidales bacterium]
MKRTITTIGTALILTGSLSAQNNDLIVVKAGTKLLDYFTVAERYLYSEFIPGRVIFTNGSQSDRNLNYNFIAGEIEFIQRHDTLSIANRKDVRMVLIAQDTFYYDNGYIELIRSGSPGIGQKQFIDLKEIQKKDPYGTASSGGASSSYSSLPADGNFYKLTADKDIVFKKTIRYYIKLTENDFRLFNRKNVLDLYPGSKKTIKSYLKTNKVKFDSKEDLFKLAEFLQKL